MFCDETQIKLGDEIVTVKRLTRGEVQKYFPAIAVDGFAALGDDDAKLFAEHCRTADGKPLDASELSIPQSIAVMKALVGAPDEFPLSDFIGLLLQAGAGAAKH